MWRFALTSLMAINLLTCPLRCLSCQAAILADDGCAETACRCCQHSAPSDKPEPMDRSPADDCTCPNCICEGATRPVDPELAEASSAPAPVEWLPPVSVASVSQGHSGRLAPEDRPPRFSGGRDALIAHDCWLV